jgi:23S rRNA (uracil1939-C5)-methyltransferase
MRRRRRKKLPTTPITLDIESLSHEGRGIAHHEGKVVFVEGALSGEQVEAVLTDRRSSFDVARITEIHNPSKERIDPACEYAGICGGCSLLHLKPEAQLLFKQEMLFDKLSHAVPGKDFTALEALTGPVLGYRRKARLAVRYVHKKSQVLVGFREKNSSFITHMDNCQVLDVRIASLLPELSELIGGLEGFREIPQIEVAAGDPDFSDTTFALVFRHLQPLAENDQEKLTAFAAKKGFALYFQPGGMETVHKVFPVGGIDRLYYRLPEFELTLGFHPTDFTQVNAEINCKMVSRALELLELVQEDSVLDLFCGLGNFTLALARKCGSIIGIEGAQAMVERASENAAANGITNADFYCADLSRSMSGASWMAKPCNKVLLDPPRSGALEILPDIVKLQPERIVYVSCNPATLARDAGYLSEHGYVMALAGAMDMFPQTAHVEAMVLFLRSDTCEAP